MNPTHRFRRGWMRRLGIIVVAVALLAVLVAWLNLRGEAPLEQGTTAATASAAVIERGAYLARAGNCIGCHTTVGGAEFAGGRGVETPFGTVFASNITPHPVTGIGNWSPGDFWRAIHHGRSKDGRLLYPAFPYPSFTTITREDSDALHAHLRSVKPVEQANRRHDLRFPYGTQAALAVWRALFFGPAEFVPEPQRGADWNRGKYLVQGLGHCAACHSGRNVLGGIAMNAEYAGGLMPDRTWYAPSLASPAQAGVQGWPRDEVIELLKVGVSTRASVAGPMAEVVYSSTQHLDERDLGAIARYLASLPAQEPESSEVDRATPETLQRGGKLYEQHCASCHGDDGQGVADIYPALAGNRAVTLDVPNNVVQLIRKGGFAPTTAGNPRPFGMPPFGQVLGNDDIAAVATYIRQSWGNVAVPVSALDVRRVE